MRALALANCSTSHGGGVQRVAAKTRSAACSVIAAAVNTRRSVANVAANCARDCKSPSCKTRAPTDMRSAARCWRHHVERIVEENDLKKKIADDNHNRWLHCDKQKRKRIEEKRDEAGQRERKPVFERVSLQCELANENRPKRELIDAVRMLPTRSTPHQVCIRSYA